MPRLQIRERNRRIVNNYGITLRYNSRSGTHNMYKEFRDVTLNDAVQNMCTFVFVFVSLFSFRFAFGVAHTNSPPADMDMAGRHRARFSSIQIRDTKIVPSGVRAAKRDASAPAASSDNVKQFLSSKIKFPLAHRVPRASHRSNKTTFKANLPTTFFS